MTFVFSFIKSNTDKYMKFSKHILKKLICLILVSSISMSAFLLCSYAVEAWPEGVYVASEGACLMDADSGTVLFGKDEGSAYYPASITKVLTALITLENCQNLSEQVTFSYDAVHIEEENSTIIGASEGDRLSVLDCLYSLLFQSANEVANALAEHVGAKHPELKEEGMSDRDVFVKMMNMKAEELGCRGSHFNNPSGLTDSNHYTTAYDMCLIMAAAIKNDQFLDIESHTYWTHAPIKRYPNADDPWNTVYPKHMMLKKNSSQYYAGTIAGKTGYTMTAGNTLVTACVRDGMTLVTCVLNAHANHYNDTRRLMDFGFDNFTSLKLSDYTDIANEIQSDFSVGGAAMLDAYTIGISPDSRITIPKSGSYVEVEKKLEISETEESGASARLIYTYGGRRVGAAELKLTSIGAKISESEAAEDPLLARILGYAEDNADDGGANTDGTEINDSSASADESEDSSQSESSENNEPETISADTAEEGGGTDTPAADNAEGSTEEKTDHESNAALGSMLIKITFGLLAAAAVIIVLAGIRIWVNRRRARKREQRRIARMRRNAYMNGEMQEAEPVYQSSRRTLRKTKRKRKR